MRQSRIIFTLMIGNVLGRIMVEILQYLNTIGPLQLIGLLGFVVYILAFGWVQVGWMDGNSAKYSLCNVLAASLVAVSLIAEFNLSSALIQGSWILIGLAGLVKRQFFKGASRFSAPLPLKEVV
jgi:hypothetical protein